jgi:hypothetical protein
VVADPQHCLSALCQSLNFFIFQIEGGACGLTLTANAVMFLTIFGFFVAFDNDDVQYSVW